MFTYQKSNDDHAKPLVLVVDDQEIIAELLREQLQKYFTVKIAYSGKEAIEFCNKLTPDFILMDVFMPEMDGIEVCRIINQHRDISQIPVMFLTGAESTEIELKCWEVGCVDFLSKPALTHNLNHKINVHLAMKARVKTLESHTVLKAPDNNNQANWYIEFLETQCEIASFRQMPLSIVMIKIRDFDLLIQTNGWASVDNNVTNLSKLIVQELFHSVDVMVRYQRDTFLCILPDSGPEATRHFVFMLQRAIAKHDPLKLADEHNPAFLGIIGVTKLDGKFDGATILAEVEGYIEDTLNKSTGLLSAQQISDEKHKTQIITAHNG